MSLSPKEIEDGEDGMSEDKDNGSRDEIVIPPKKGRKVATPPEKKVERKKSLAPTFAEKLVSPSRKRATWAKRAKDRCATPEDRESRRESYEEEEDQDEPVRKTADKRKKEMANQKASPETKKQKLEDRDARTLLIKNLPDKVTQHALKEVFEDAFQVRLVSKAGMSKRYVLYLVLKKNICLLDSSIMEFRYILLNHLCLILEK
ncbi:nucleolin-like [Trichechus manatus latirostris]|uniref:Nucleolin-like n=1 Tax=Trichechus manatus latirostris TaxID=127582 RepID=A0A2Y9QAW8_TRIMA|nr:nucleolin-like [Trichechus manatus latirostris]